MPYVIYRNHRLEGGQPDSHLFHDFPAHGLLRGLTGFQTTAGRPVQYCPGDRVDDLSDQIHVAALE